MLGPYCHVGPGTRLNQWCEVGRSCDLGARSRLGQYCRIGEWSTLGPRCRLSRRVVVESFCKLGPRCSIGRLSTLYPHCSMGAGCSVEGPVNIGTGCGFGEGCSIDGRGIAPVEGCSIDFDFMRPHGGPNLRCLFLEDGTPYVAEYDTGGMPWHGDIASFKSFAAELYCREKRQPQRLHWAELGWIFLLLESRRNTVLYEMETARRTAALDAERSGL